MGGMSSKIGTILDPANLFEKRPGGVSWRGALDPGGTIIKSTTGSDIGLKAADPGKLMVPPGITDNTSEAAARRKAAEDAKTAETKKKKLKNYYKLRSKSNIMTTELEDY